MALSDYVQIEYIQGVDGAYIDTGIQGRRTHSYKFVCTIPTDIGSRATIYGAEGSTNKYNWGILADGSAYRVRYAAASPSVPLIQSTIADPRILFIEQIMDYPSVTATTPTGKIRIKDYETQQSLITDVAFSYGGSNSNLNRNLYIMALNASSSGSPSYPAINCRLYSFNIYNYVTADTSSILREYIPIRDPATGNVGLYDTWNDVPYWSGGANFIAGPDIGSASKLWIRQSGTWNSGTPYIRQSGSWSTGKPYIRQSGSWNQGS